MFRLTLAFGLFCAALPAQEKPSYVAVEKASGAVGFFDADGKLLKEVSIGGHPHEMTFSPERRYLYTTDNGVLWMTETGQGGNTVSIVDTITESLTGRIDLGRYRRPHGIDVIPETGNLLVTTELPSRLLLVNPAAQKIVREYDIKGKAPHLVKLAADHIWAYTTNTDSGTVSAVNLQTGDVKTIAVGERPQGMAFSPEGRRLYVTNLNSDSITIIDTQAKAPIGNIPTGKGPVRIMITPDARPLSTRCRRAKLWGSPIPRHVAKKPR